MSGILRCTRVFLCISLYLPVIGSRTRPLPETTLSNFSTHPDLKPVIQAANEAFHAGAYTRAAALYAEGLKRSREKKHRASEASCFLGLGNCYVNQHRYRDANEAYSQAAQLATDARNWDFVARLIINRSTLYRKMGDLDAALQTVKEVNPILPKLSDPGMKPRLLLHAALLYSKKGDLDRAIPVFLAGIEEALQRGDIPTASSGWNQLGFEYLKHGRIKEADRPLTEAFRLRRLSGSGNLGSSYIYLGMQRLADKDPRSAVVLFDRAIDLSQESPLLPYTPFYHRARAKSAQGDLDSALADFRQAIALARQWRLEVLPADSFQISAEVGLQEMYSRYISTGMSLYWATGDDRVAVRMFSAAEENRAVALRQQLSVNRQLPPEYVETLGKYRRAVISSLADPSDEAAHWKLKLAEIESHLGLDAGTPPVENSHQEKESNASEFSLFHLRQHLKTDEVLFSFHTDGEQSYAWALTRDAFEVQRITGREQLSEQMKRFREAVRAGKSSDKEGESLYSELFGRFDARLTGKRSWLLSLDGPLFDVPFAALRVPSGAGSQYLAELHPLRSIPGANFLGLASQGDVSGRFVGIGDVIYNAADPRWTGAEVSGGAHELPRLPGSRREVRVSAEAWGQDKAPRLLVGPAVTRRSLDEAMSLRPAVLHVATHVVQRSPDKAEALIALGLRADGEFDYLAPAEIASWRSPLGVVALSGCASGTGKILPGAGLVGLSRAWLVSGARGVMGTYWPIGDDAEHLFAEFYKGLADRGSRNVSATGAAAALQAAQIEMIRSGDWRAKPAYWAAFFVVGKD
jgi:CHAT domain-containing protein/Tfp pilus assembly protein PilF